MEVIHDYKLYLTECLKKLPRNLLIKIAYSWSGNSECNFDETSFNDIILLIVESMGVEGTPNDVYDLFQFPSGV